MERHIQIFLNKLSFASITIATLTLLFLFLQTPDTCVDTTTSSASSSHHLLKPHPKSSCEISHRSFTSLEKRNHRLWSTNAWSQTLSSYTSLFLSLNIISNHSKTLIVSAGPGHAVMALNRLGVVDVTGVELIDSPPLVNRADPHNLPFFDDVFDLGFSDHLDEALFPDRYVREMERTVRVGGACVVAVHGCGAEEVKRIVMLFRRSKFVGAMNVTLIGVKMTRIVMRIMGTL